MFLLPIGIFITSINIILINWNVRVKKFKKNATSLVGTSLSMKAFQIGYGSIHSGIFPGLIYADLVSKSLGSILLLFKNMIIYFRYLLKINWSEMKKIGMEYKKYPTYLLASNFVNKTTSDIPLYLLSSFFGLGAVGAFGFANQMLNIPFNVIGNSIAPVYYQRAKELHQIDSLALKEFTIKSYNRMLLLGCLAFGFIFAFGDLLFKLIFSYKWELAGQMAMLLSVYYVFKLISSPFARIFRVVRKEEITLKVNITLAILRIVGIGVGLYTNSVLMAIGCFSFTNLLGYAYNNLQVFKVLNIDSKIILKSTIIVMAPIFLGMSLLRILLNSIFNI